MTESFEILEHPSDLGIRAWGKTLAEAFENAARGLVHVMVEPGAAQRREARTVTIRASNPEHLLVRWLSEILFLYDAERLVPSSFRINQLSDTSLEAEIAGEALDEQKHAMKLDVKAITYHQIRVEQAAGRHQVTVFVDI